MIEKSVQALAKRLFETAKANGIVKQPRAIAAGSVGVVTMSKVTWRDYVRDARAILKRRLD